MLIGLLHFPVQIGCGNTLRAMAENNHLLHAVRCSHTNTVLARQVVGRLLNVHIRGFGLLGVDDMDTAALLDRAGAAFDLIGIEHENKMTPAHALIIAQHVDERFAGGVDITGSNVAQLVPREDIHSYAELRLCDAVGGAKVLEFSFTWLKDAGRDSVSGYTERIRLPYEPFRSYAAGEKENIDGTRWRLLSIPEQSRPKLEFHSRKNLKAVVENPILRHKLGKFLDQHFNWYNYERIVLTDDYLPYSFFFEGYMVPGAKTCGGVILHGGENIQTAKYGIHT